MPMISDKAQIKLGQTPDGSFKIHYEDGTKTIRLTDALRVNGATGHLQQLVLVETSLNPGRVSPEWHDIPIWNPPTANDQQENPLLKDLN